jgi:ElaB/YqjD/DUF883 family membrane-anchored ribosome-binding protein
MSAPDSAETARIRAEIERTRAEMSGTIDAIQDKLSPQHIAEQVRHTVHEQFEEAKATVRDATIGKAETLMRDASERVSDVRYTLSDTVRTNPIPAAMVAIGLGWLFMNRGSARPRHERRYEGRYDAHYAERYGSNRPMTYETSHPAYRGEAVAMYPGTQRHDEGAMARGQRMVGDAADRAQSAVGDAANRAQSAVGDAANRTQEAVSGAVSQAQDAVGGALTQAQRAVGDAANRVQEQAGAFAGRTVYQVERVEDRFQETLRENPLAVGAVALAIGAAVGFTLPGTERENQLMGEARDSLVQQAQSAAQETIEKVQQVAGDVAKETEQKVTEKAREAGLTGEGR